MGLFRRRQSARGPQVREWSASTEQERGGDSEPAHARRPEATQPQPERREPELPDPGLKDLSKRDYTAVIMRAGKESHADAIMDSAAALAYYAFVAIPATLLTTVGVFSLFGSGDAVETITNKLEGLVPPEAIALLEDSLHRVLENQNGGLVMVIVGVLVALWTATGAMNGLMRALNVAYDRKETRNFLKQRLTALAMLALMLLAFALVFGLLVLGGPLSKWIGDAIGLEAVFGWIWWTAQWPILLLGLLFAFAGLLYLGPNVDHPRWQFLSPGAVIAVVIWLAASGLFALYVGLFGSYNKTWGSFAAVIIMLTWLWLSALALLFGAEVNAEVERSRELRQGQPAEAELQAPAKA